MADEKQERRRVWTCEYCGLETITATQMAREGLAYELPTDWYLVTSALLGTVTYCGRWCAANSASEPL